MENAIYSFDFLNARDILYGLADKYKSDLSKLDAVLLPMLNKASLSKIKTTPEMTMKYKMKVSDVILLNESRKTGHVPSYRLKPSKKIELIGDNTVLSLNWAFYKKVLNKSGNGRDIVKYQLRKRMFDQNSLKELSTYMLVHGPKADKHFYLYVGIEQLYGFNTESVTIDQSEKIKAWVNNKFYPTFNGSSSVYLDKFREKVRKTLNWKEEFLEAPYTIEEYANNIPLTSTSGSAFDPKGPREEIIIGDESYIPYNSKFAKSAVLSLENKLDRLTSNLQQRARVSVKVEVTPKSRIIVSSDYNMFLKQKFVGTWLEKWMKGNDQSTLWSTDKQKLDMWRKFGAMGLWNVPIDQSAFDHHVSKAMVQIMNEEIIYLINKRCIGATKEQLIQVMHTIIFGMNDCSISYVLPQDNDTIACFSYESGILSGWYWTAFYDTLANIAEKEVALDQLRTKNHAPNLLMFNAQGDDQLTKFKNLCMSMLYWLELSVSGFEIHPMKNFFSKNHNEYLRKYSTVDGVNAYPARLVNKIMWLYPGKQDSFSPVEKMNNIYSRWSKMRERLRTDWKKLKDLMYSDFRGAKISKLDYESYLGAKNYNGGKSFIEIKENNKIIETLPGSFKYHIEIKGEGYRQFKKTFGLGQEREMDKWMIQALSIPDVIKHKEIKTRDTMGFSQGELVDEIPFVIFKTNDKPPTPRLVKGWAIQDVFQTSDEVMRRAFSGVDTFVQNTNAPKSWLYDYYTGKLVVPLPVSDLINAEGSALLFEEYRNSLYLAMLKKGRRKERWKGLISYLQNEMIGIYHRDKENPMMFCL